MKNLSFLISIVIAISIFFSCRNNKNNTKLENQSVIEKTAIDDAAENNELNSLKNKTANKTSRSRYIFRSLEVVEFG
jgi:hypothetical protein